MRAWLCLGMACLVLAPEQARAAAVWCAAQGDGVAYVSDVRSTDASSRLALRSLSSRFVRVVNASKGTRAEPDGTACRRFADRGAATRGLTTYKVQVERQGGRVETVGIY